MGHTDMMLSDRLATDPTLGFKDARLFTISDLLMAVVYGMSSNFGRSVIRTHLLFRDYTARTAS